MDFLFINEKEKKCVGVGFVPTESKTLFFYIMELLKFLGKLMPLPKENIATNPKVR